MIGMLTVNGHRVLCKYALNAKEVVNFIKVIVLVILTNHLAIATTIQ